jgi:hypothetical protein
MKAILSRRTFVAAVGGGIVGAGSTSLATRVSRASAATPIGARTAAAVDYVDQDGWMLTPDDARAMAQAATVTPTPVTPTSRP